MSLTELITIADTAEQTDLQLDSRGGLRHLLTLQGLDRGTETS